MKKLLAVFLALVMLLSIARLLRGARFREVFFPGLRSIGMVRLQGAVVERMAEGQAFPLQNSRVLTFHQFQGNDQDRWNFVPHRPGCRRFMMPIENH